jgi:integrase
LAKALTPIAIKNLRPRADRYEVPDGGCRGLRVRVFPSGHKSFIARYRFRGVQKNLLLGSVLDENGEGEPTEAPEHDTPLSLAAARELAAKALRQAKSGNDPAAAKQKRKQEHRAAEGDTLQNVAAEYLRRKAVGRTDSQLRSDLDLVCASALGRLPVGEIGRGMFARALDHIADNNGLSRADRVRTSLNRALNWYASRSDFFNPLGRGGRRISIAEQARSRVLSDDELRRVWVAAEQDPGPFGAFVRFVLLTATRRGEAAGLRRNELSNGGTVWTIPGARYKSKRDLVLPLSTGAQDIIAKRSLFGDYAFGVDGARALTGFGERK